MVAWFIIAIATLGVFAFIAVNGVQSVAMTSDAAGRVETVRRLEAAANAVMARAVSFDGDAVVYLPAGAPNPAGQGYGLPNDLAFRSQTAFGKRFVYCPYGNTGVTGTAATIPNADGTSYSVQTRVDPVSGRHHVVGTNRPGLVGAVQAALVADPNLLGFVLAPRSRQSSSPNCRDVAYNAVTGKFEAPDAIVRALSRDAGVDETRTVDARKLTFYVAEGTPGGTGASASDRTSLAHALNYFSTRLPSHMTIDMAPGNYTMGANDLRIPLEATNYHTNLVVKGNGASVYAAPSTIVSMPGHLVLNGVMMSSDVAISVDPGSKLTMINSQVGQISNYGDARFEGNNFLTWPGSDYALIVMSGGRAHVSGHLQMYTPGRNGVLVHGDASFSVRAGTISFNTATSSRYHVGVYLQQGSSGDFSHAVLNFPVGTEYGIYAEGAKATLVSSTMSFAGPVSSYAIMALEGSTVGLSQSAVGQGVRPSYGVFDRGSLSVYGVGSTVAASAACWTGDQFAQSNHGNGASSAVLADVAPAALPATPTAAQIQAYADQRAVNATREAKRRTNRSSWACAI